MAIIAAARSIIRSSSARNAAARLAPHPKSKPKVLTSASPFRVSSGKTLSQPIFRRPVEMSFAVESMLPYHTATASALMTSMLSISRRSYGWTSEGESKFLSLGAELQFMGCHVFSFLLQFTSSFSVSSLYFVGVVVVKRIVQ